MLNMLEANILKMLFRSGQPSPGDAQANAIALSKVVPVLSGMPRADLGLKATR